MATKKSLIAERNGIWYTNYSFKGKRVRQSLGIPVGTPEARDLAEELAAKKYHELFLGLALGQFKHTWEEAVKVHTNAREKVLRKRLRKAPKDPEVIKAVQRSRDDMVHKYEVMAPYLAGRDLSTISQRDVEDIRRHLFKDGARGEGTVNRYLTLLGATLARCLKKENEDGSPWLTRIPNIEKEEENDPEYVDISQEQLSDIYEALPPVQQDMFVVSIETGLRANPMRIMEKDCIDFEKRIAFVKGVHQKNQDSIEVPLSEPCMAALLRACNRYPDSKYVFATETGKPIYKCSNKPWYAALKKAGLWGGKDESGENIWYYRWHFNRHIFVQNHIADGTPEIVIMALGGWRNPDMIRRYAKTKGRKYAKFVDSVATNLTQLTDFRTTNLAQTLVNSGGADGTRTRDPRRDRRVS